MPTTSTIVSTIAFMLAACAQGGSGEPGDGGNGGNDAKPIDGSMQPHNDAPVQPSDAPLPVDAAPMLPDGAPPGSNLFCAVNADCTASGECCFNFGGAFPQSFCVLGSPLIPNTETCFPD